jgi:hypothetical protein
LIGINVAATKNQQHRNLKNVSIETEQMHWRKPSWNEAGKHNWAIDVQANQIGQCAKVRRHRSIQCALVHQPREFEELACGIKYNGTQKNSQDDKIYQLRKLSWNGAREKIAQRPAAKNEPQLNLVSVSEEYISNHINQQLQVSQFCQSSEKTDFRVYCAQESKVTNGKELR